METISKNEYEISGQEILEFIEGLAISKGWELETLPQIQFNAVCRLVGVKFFDKKTCIFYNGNAKNTGLNLVTIKQAAAIYNHICDLYNKVPSVKSFTLFLNIDDKVLFDIVADGKDGASLCQELLHDVAKNRENNLKDRAIDKGGAVGVAIVGNSEFFWNDPFSASRIATTTPSNTSKELPDFNSMTRNKALIDM